jgi:hypothetical protein
MTFFDRVKREVKYKKNMSIEDWLDSVFSGEVNRDAYNGWRKRNLLPRLDIAVRMARDFGTTVKYLLDGIDPNLTKEDHEILSLARKYKPILYDLENLIPETLQTIQTMIHAAAMSQVKKNEPQLNELPEGSVVRIPPVKGEKLEINQNIHNSAENIV